MSVWWVWDDSALYTNVLRLPWYHKAAENANVMPRRVPLREKSPALGLCRPEVEWTYVTSERTAVTEQVSNHFFPCFDLDPDCAVFRVLPSVR